MKKNIIISLALLLFLGCTKENNTTNSNATNCIEGQLDEVVNANQIVGEWKLLRTKSYLFENDYTAENIIYNFQSNGNLIVSGGENIGGFPNGTYSYVFDLDYLSNSENPNEPMIWIVKIDGLKWTYASQNDLMIIGQSYVDGADLCFEKVQNN